LRASDQEANHFTEAQFVRTSQDLTSVEPSILLQHLISLLLVLVVATEEEGPSDEHLAFGLFSIQSIIVHLRDTLQPENTESFLSEFMTNNTKQDMQFLGGNNPTMTTFSDKAHASLKTYELNFKDKRIPYHD
jgi:hypothetical protein